MEFIWQATVAHSSSRRNLYQPQWLKNKRKVAQLFTFLHILSESRAQSLNEDININVIIVKNPEE